MVEITSKTEKLELLNGETVELTFNFARLLWLRNNGYGKEIEMAMKTFSSEKLDFLEMPYYFYAAYLCANKDIKYTQDEFVSLVPWDIREISEIFARLTNKKKVEVSKTRSSAIGKKTK